MSQPDQPPQGAPLGAPLGAVKIVGLPTLGTVPLGPDEPELFADAMERILDHLSDEDFDAGGRSA
jgi:hypothetical protein